MVRNKPDKNSDLDNEPLYLIDGSSFIFRAYYALPPLTNPQGVPVNAVLGFVNMITKLLTDMNAHSLAVVFDAKRENFRNNIYPDYKANRSEAPEDLVPQFPLIREAVEAFNLPCLELEGFEADDLIATYTRLAKEQNRRVIIVSSDKDLMQLIGDKVMMLDTMKNKEFGPEQVIEKFGVPPEKVVEVQALSGDSVDNIPGVPGIGLKTAAQLISDYGDLETLLERALEIKQNKRRESLIEFAEQARLSKKLVMLDDRVPVPISVDGLHLQTPNPDELLNFLERQGFKTTIARIQNRLNLHAENRANIKTTLQENSPKKPIYTVIENEKDLQTWVNEAFEHGMVAVDTETTGLTPAKADLVGISLCVKSGKACYIPLKHVDGARGSFDFDHQENDKKENRFSQIDFNRALAILKPLLEAPSVLKIGHNMKYDWQMFYGQNIDVRPIDDTMLLSYVLDGAKHRHGMDDLSELFLGKKPVAFKDIAGTGKGQKRFDEILIAEAAPYAAEDADITKAFYDLFKPRLLQERMVNLYEKIERPLIPVIAKMEYRGIKIDPSILKRMSNDFAIKLDQLEKDIHQKAGTTFNIASPKQLGEILFDQLGLQGSKKSKTGAWSTAQNVLEPLALQGHEIVEQILEWRGLAKLKSTYTDALPEQINPKTGRVHSSFMMSVTSTGRLSSSDPNLQNIPIRTEEGRKIRTAFIPENGYKLVALDYSQIELRLAAEMADIEVLKEAFRNGDDIHAHTASQVFDIPLKDITPEIRRKAKAINFGIIYGISGYGLAKQIGADMSDASQYIKQYMARFPELESFMEKQKSLARKQGYVTTLMGRKCFVGDINNKNFSARSFAERQAINAPLQGTAADIIKKAMIKVDRAIDKNNWPVRLLLQVHDELVFEIKEQAIQDTVPQIKEIMETVLSLSIPLLVDVGVGDNWAEAH